ncbi:hypothetical protein C9374_003417 [Naegleria lovaniensis]|uniref:SUN domain-containing protein n=1 Tax=Naegleria lovaniensis TaxID=51637 RepID=A0AA88KPN9_NAELO|nr:uncharacterized protein C9374_003417 [Naegleria lovaniensis]KAG2385602.1 hypothetical protein C9374_003417 [Naegleria lovaniensis]
MLWCISYCTIIVYHYCVYHNNWSFMGRSYSTVYYNSSSIQKDNFYNFVRASDESTTSEKLNVGFNFAAEESGAKILASNPEAKKVSRILNEDSDKYCLIPRTAPQKWIIVELSEEILMKSIALANFEYYSCSFKHFKVYGSVKYPCKGQKCWELVGSFQASNGRKVQSFIFKKPSITRYIKLEFLTHYGEAEYYCTLSLLRVHGSTLLEDLKKSLQKSSSRKSHEPSSIDAATPQMEEDSTPKLETKHDHHTSDNMATAKIIAETITTGVNDIQANLTNFQQENKTASETENLEEQFGKLLHDDISDFLKQSIDYSKMGITNKSKTNFWASQIKHRLEKLRVCLLTESPTKKFLVVPDIPTMSVMTKQHYINSTIFLKNYSSPYMRPIDNTSSLILSRKHELQPICLAPLRVIWANVSCPSLLRNNSPETIQNVSQSVNFSTTESATYPKTITDDDDDDIDDGDDEAPEDTLSQIINEKENILKSLFNAIKVHGENEVFLRNQIKSLENRYLKTVQYIQQVLEKNGEDHKTIANSFVSLTQKQREAIVSELRHEIDTKLKTKIEEFSTVIDSKIAKIREEQAQQLRSLRKEFLVYGGWASILILFFIFIARPKKEIVIRGRNSPYMDKIDSPKREFQNKGKSPANRLSSMNLLSILYSFFFQNFDEHEDGSNAYIDRRDLYSNNISFDEDAMQDSAIKKISQEEKITQAVVGTRRGSLKFWNESGNLNLFFCLVLKG